MSDLYIHPTAIVDGHPYNGRIGDGTKIWHFVHVMPDAKIGRDCVIGQGCFIGDVKIGDNVHIQNNVSIYDGVTLEDDVFCGPSCVFTNVKNPRAALNRKKEYAETRVLRGATIGANATIVCGVTIGRYAFVGAGAVVTRYVPPYALFLGAPASRVGWVCRCGEVLPVAAYQIATLACARCGARYRSGPSRLTPLEG